jgi:predicted  nucleic acid-binding Zn-ribbon protein
MKSSKPLLLLLLSIGLTATWIYHLYDKNRYTSQRNNIYIKDSAAIADAIKDSLQKFYAETVSRLDTRLDSTRINMDSLKGQLDSRVVQINSLRGEISDILSKRTITRSELNSARDKINELRSRIDELKTHSTSLEKDRTRLDSTLAQLTLQIKDLEQNVKNLETQNKQLNEVVTAAHTFVASDIKLAAIDIKSNRTREVETSLARKADKFVVTMYLQNTVSDIDHAIIYIIVTAPNGQVITSPVWDSDSFDTKTEGRKVFTRSVKFDYTKNEHKLIVFSLDYNLFIKGTYNMQVYHNGVLIGETSTTLR